MRTIADSPIEDVSLSDGPGHAPSSSSPRPVPGNLGIVAALMTLSWCLLDRLYKPSMPWLATAAAVLGVLALALTLMRPWRWRTLCLVGAIALVSGLWLASLDRALISMETRLSPMGAFARVIAPVVSQANYMAGSGGGRLHVVHPEGLLSIIPSSEKIGLRPLIELWTLWVILLAILDRSRIVERAVAGALGLMLVAIVRFAACVLIYLEHDEILMEHEGFNALSDFSGPTVVTATLVISGLVLGAVRKWLPPDLGAVLSAAIPFRRSWRILAGSAVLGLLIGIFGTFEPPGRMKPGRILIDDRYCGVWEPTARLLDTEWYGDFSTYSFGSLAEWLGHWYSVDVNTRRRYDDDLLKNYDVLILKTPVQPFPKEEQAAIDRFVTRGGGLLLVGDHTNLLGMGTHLNSLCDKYGLRFRYDSVSDATTGGFVDYFGPALGRNVASLHVDHLQFMTSCSLEIDHRAQAIITSSTCRRDPHDYAGSSFFGRVGPHPEMSHGPTVLAATARAGQGMIAAFTDSTVWSSFAIFQYDREKLAADLVGLLNRKQSPLETPLRMIAIGLSAVALVLTIIWVRSGAALFVVLGGLLGIWSGVFAADQCHETLYQPRPPRAPIQEVTFLWQGGSCAFPPVLGSIDSLPLDRAFDTLFVSIQRLGFFPRVAYTYDRDLFTKNTRVLFVIAPVDTPPRATLAKIHSFVSGGGSLVVIDDGRLGGSGSAPEYLRLFGVDLHYEITPGINDASAVHSSLSGIDELKDPAAPGTFIGHAVHGAGHIIYMREASHFSRTGMGHCFSRPGKLHRARYDIIFRLFKDVLHLSAGDRKFYGIL